jgi:hypothetical protein
VAGLCPTTEANLGDGIFDFAKWRGHGGAWGVGSDSHASVNAAEELLMLEYSQRLAGASATWAPRGAAACGDGVHAGGGAGRRAGGGPCVGGLAAGQQADFVVLDASHLALQGLSAPDMLSAHVFASHRTSAIDAVWVAGRARVSAGRHALHGAPRPPSWPRAPNYSRIDPTMAFTTTEPPFRFRQGTRPLLISMPHVGTHVPPALAARFTDEARHVPDTDWHLEQLYDFADALGASVLVATHSRYVVDLNRPPDGASLYPGQSVTGLCPVDTFDDTPVYANAATCPATRKIAAAPRRRLAAVPREAAEELARIRRSTAWPRCGTRTRSARCCRASSKASCPT